MSRYWMLLLWIFLFVTPLSAEENGNVSQIPATLEEAGTADEVYAYINHVFAEMQKKIKTEEDQKQFFADYPPFAVAAADKILALSAENDEMLETGYGIKLYALSLLCRAAPENDENKSKLRAVTEEVKKLGKFPELMKSQRIDDFYSRLQTLEAKTLSQEDFDKSKEEARELLVSKTKGYSAAGPVRQILELAGEIEDTQNKSGFLEATLNEIIEWVKSDRFLSVYSKEASEKTEKQLRGYCRRLVGCPFELYGKTVDDQDFSWEDYKDKTVLIDFTASWCGPCRAEMPNLLEVYGKYHGKGFEIISVGIWDGTENLKKQIEEDKIPWPMVSEELQKDKNRELPHEYYGIEGVPTIFLVKDGKIIATGLRGPVLYSRVAKLFEEKE
ncbi:MAG: TlpA family protein disulfide reductase [Planctomycetaceae bacterium]|nr:TlpA family protein disulfide reductase [Planctomycetaceae bacterium]